jgi:hypothetical protein
MYVYAMQLWVNWILINHKQLKKGLRGMIKKLNVILFFASAATSFIAASEVHQRPSSYPFIAGDTFRSIADHIIDETEQPFSPRHVKPYDIIFLKTDLAPKFFATVHSLISVPYILITHNSDLSPIYLQAADHPWLGYDMSKYLNDPKLVVWFAQNIDYGHPKLKPLPIGIANRYNAHGNIEIFKTAIQYIPSWEVRSHKVYLNFTVQNNVRERQPVLNFFRSCSYAHIADFKPPAQYLEEMKRYQYVINPPGNGLDCHRTWEALMLGCAPIIKHSILDPLFTDLPVILINDWAEVTQEFLEHKSQEIRNKKYNVEKAYADYWIRLIKSYKK